MFSTGNTNSKAVHSSMSPDSAFVDLSLVGRIRVEVDPQRHTFEPTLSEAHAPQPSSGDEEPTAVHSGMLYKEGKHNSFSWKQRRHFVLSSDAKLRYYLVEEDGGAGENAVRGTINMTDVFRVQRHPASFFRPGVIALHCIGQVILLSADTEEELLVWEKNLKPLVKQCRDSQPMPTGPGPFYHFLLRHMNSEEPLHVSGTYDQWRGRDQRMRYRAYGCSSLASFPKPKCEQFPSAHRVRYFLEEVINNEKLINSPYLNEYFGIPRVVSHQIQEERKMLKKAGQVATDPMSSEEARRHVVGILMEKYRIDREVDNVRVQTDASPVSRQTSVNSSFHKERYVPESTFHALVMVSVRQQQALSKLTKEIAMLKGVAPEEIDDFDSDSMLVNLVDGLSADIPHDFTPGPSRAMSRSSSWCSPVGGESSSEPHAHQMMHYEEL